MPTPIILQTTRRLAATNGACSDGIERAKATFADLSIDAPINLADIAEKTDLGDALWCLRIVLPGQEADRDRFARLFACRCAFAVLPIFERSNPSDDRPRNAIRVARRFAIGEATKEEMAAARDAARAAARDAAWAAAWDAARDAAWDAARDAARAAARAAAWDAARAAAWDAAQDAAWDAAQDAAWDAQRSLFIATLRGEIELDYFPGLQVETPAALAV